MNADDQNEVAEQILDAAVVMAEKTGWEAVRLNAVARSLGIGLDDVRRHYREKDALIDAWFDRADAAALTLADSGALDLLSPRERLFALIMRWLDAMEDHRTVTRQMIQAKLEPGHLHIQLPAVTRISRTVQWMREGAGLEDSGLCRALTETATTAIYLAVFTRWLGERSAGSPRTRRLLDRMLHQAERLVRLCPSPSRRSGADEAGKSPPAWTP